MRELILSLVGPASPGKAETEALLSGVRAWGPFCAVVQRIRCAPLVYTRLRAHAPAVPPHVLNWLREQGEAASSRTDRLLAELRAVTAGLAADGVPALVLKGPVLAVLGTGLHARVFHDLDLLVPPASLARAAAALTSMGFIDLRTGHHDYHRTFAKASPNASAVLELHFGTYDRERRCFPDLDGLWTRAVDVDISGHTYRTVSATDHLLLTILQLPHHHWDLRLAVDISHVVAGQAAVIDWAGFASRARTWGMRALAASALNAVAALWGVELPPQIAAFRRPDHYVQRVQGRLVQQALFEQLSLERARLGRAAEYLILDRPKDALAAAIHHSLMHHDRVKTLAGIARRLRIGIEGMPELLAILARTAFSQPPNVSR